MNTNRILALAWVSASLASLFFIPPCTTTENRWAKWTKNLPGEIIDVDLQGNWLVVSTPASVFALDASDGAVLYQTRTRLGSYGGVRRNPGTNRVWVTDMHYEADITKQAFRLYDLDVVTDTVLRFFEYTVPKPHILNKAPVLRIDLSSDAAHVAFVFNYGYDDPSEWPYLAGGRRSVLYWINTTTMKQLFGFGPYANACNISPDNKLLSLAGVWSFSRNLGSKDAGGFYYDGTWVIDILGDTLVNGKQIEYQFQPSPLFDFFFRYRTVISSKDLKPVLNAATSLINDNVVAYTPDALAYFSFSRPPYDSVMYVYRDVLTNDTLALLRSPVFNDPVSFYFPFDSVMVAANQWGAITFFDLKGLLGGRPGIIMPVGDTLTERMIIRLPDPQTSPVSARSTFQYTSNASFLKNRVLFSYPMDSVWIAVEADLENGLKLRTEKRVELVPLKHDALAIQYWSMGRGSGLASHISDNGRYITSARGNVSIITDITDWKIDIGFYPLSFVESVAIDNYGIVHSLNTVVEKYYVENTDYGKLSSTTYRYTIRSRKRNKISDSLQSFTYTDRVYPGVRSFVTITKWKEGFGSRVATLVIGDNSFFDTLAFDVANGTALPYSDEFCGFFPRAFDIDVTTGKKYLAGFVMNSLPNYNRYGTMSQDGRCDLIGSGQDFRYFSLSADGKYLISNQGVRDVNFEMITPTTAFAKHFLPLSGTATGITANADTIFLWQIPEATLINKFVCHAEITGISSTGTSDRLLIQFANGTIELMRTLDMFPEPPIFTDDQKSDDVIPGNSIFPNPAIGSSGTANEITSGILIFPNPAFGSSRITSPLFNLPDAQLNIYNSLGERIVRVTSGLSGSGFEWNTTDSDGLRIKPGIYYCIASAQGEYRFGKVSVLR